MANRISRWRRSGIFVKWAEIWVWHCWEWCPGCTGRGWKSSVCQTRIPKLLSNQAASSPWNIWGKLHCVWQQAKFYKPFRCHPEIYSGIRLIHDCSRPSGNSLNDYATLEFSQRFQTIDDATSLLQPGYYMAKIDLKSAYRSVSISAESQQFTGLKFVLNNQVVYLCDTLFALWFKTGTWYISPLNTGSQADDD